MTVEGETRNPEEAAGLRRELRFWEAIALSIAIMAPTAAMALNGTVPAQLVGQAVPLAFIFATVGVIFVSYAFIRLSGYFSSPSPPPRSARRPTTRRATSRARSAPPCSWPAGSTSS